MFNRWRSIFKRVDWVNAAFLAITPIIGLGGAAFLAEAGLLDTRTLILALVMLVLSGLAVTAGYHRLFAHRSYEAKSLIRAFFLFFGAASFENSALRWASDHRTHHLYVDTDRDPYSIKRGFWFAHIGWVLLKYPTSHSYTNVPDLERDPLVKFQDRYYIFIGILVGFLLPMGLAALWGDALGGLIVAGFLRVVLNHHFTFAINSVAHLIGRQPYSNENSSRDSWWLALLTYGEGYHNYHHRFPSDYRNGIRAYHWDPTKWFIRFLAWIGQTHHLRQIPKEAILRARLQMDQKRVVHRIRTNPAAAHLSAELVAAARLKIEHAYSQLRALKAEYERAKAEDWNQVSLQFQRKRNLIRAQMRQGRRQLEAAFADWARICSRHGIRPTRFSYLAT